MSPGWRGENTQPGMQRRPRLPLRAGQANAETISRAGHLPCTPSSPFGEEPLRHLRRNVQQSAFVLADSKQLSASNCLGPILIWLLRFAGETCSLQSFNSGMPLQRSEQFGRVLANIDRFNVEM